MPLHICLSTWEHQLLLLRAMSAQQLLQQTLQMQRASLLSPRGCSSRRSQVIVQNVIGFCKSTCSHRCVRCAKLSVSVKILSRAPFLTLYGCMLCPAALSLIFVGATINYTILQVRLRTTLCTSGLVWAFPAPGLPMLSQAHMQSQ